MFSLEGCEPQSVTPALQPATFDVGAWDLLLLVYLVCYLSYLFVIINKDRLRQV